MCLDHLTPAEARALEQDLNLAARVQRGLLPPREALIDGWEAAHHYQPAGAVSGDYCDLIRADNGDAYFLLGDVAGKGVSAAMLMSHLSALLRTLVSVGLPLSQLMERTSRVVEQRVRDRRRQQGQQQRQLCPPTTTRRSRG